MVSAVRLFILTALVSLGAGQDPLWVRFGGSLNMQDGRSERAREVHQGLTLLADVVNATRPFLTSDGRPILLKVMLEDDQGDDATTRSIYARLLTPSTTTAHAVLGPTPDTAISEVIAMMASTTLTNDHVPLILHQTLQSEPQAVGAFAVGAHASELLTDSLTHLRQRGAQKAFFAWPATAWAETVCLGGIETAAQLGFSITNFTGPSGESSLSIQAATAAYEDNPDIFIGCGDDVNSIITVINLVALDVNPTGIVLTNSISPGFHEALGSVRANYIVGPSMWSRDLHASRYCKVFGSAASFYTQYQNSYDTSPTEHAAQAVAAAMALLAAVESRGGATSREEILAGLSQLDVNETFYGKLSFNERGFLEDHVARTMQIQPLPANMPQRLRYSESIFEVVGGDTGNQALWPAPTWVSKELEIYPCADGHYLNMTDLNFGCAPCEVGTHRPYTSVVCRPCGVGFYSDVAGLPECKVCPSGADCYLGQTTGIPPAQAGYYRLGDGTSAYRYDKCDPADVCLADNQCLGKNSGILCAGCETWYSNRGVFTQEEGVCVECPHPVVNFLLMSIGVIINIAHMAVAAWLTHTAATRIFELHAVVFKLFMEYAHLMTITLMGFEVTFLSPTLYHSFLQSPVSVLESLKCLFGNAVDVRAAAVYTGWGLLPTVMGANTILFLGVFALTIRLFRTENRRVTKQKMREAAPLNQKAAVATEGEPTEDGSHSGNSRDFLEKELLGADAESEESEAHSSDSSSDDELDELPDMKVQWRRCQYMFNHFICWQTVWIFLLYPVEVSMLLEPLRCVELDTLRLEADLNVLCSSDEHWPWILAAVAGMVVYGAGIPAGIFFLLFKFRYKLDHVGVRRSLGFLFNGFNRNYYFYEVFHMVRKGGLLVAAAAPVMFVRTAAMLFVMVAFLALEVHLHPYDNRDFGVLFKVEELMSVCVISTILTRLFHILRKDIGTSVFASTANSWIVDFSISGACLVLHFVFLSWIGWLMFRDFFLKPGSYKAMLMPKRMTLTERILQRLERNANLIRYEAKGQNFNLQNLSPKELGFFTTVLCETMDCYIRTINQFHPGFVVTALKEAISLCIRDRRRRAQELSDLLTVKKKAKQWRISRRFEKMSDSINSVWRALEGDFDEPQDDVGAEANKLSALEKTNLEVRELRRMKQCRKDAMAAASASSATTEELHNALLLCWPDIAEHRQRFYTVDRRAFAATPAQRSDNSNGEGGGGDSVKDDFASLKLRSGLSKAQKLLGGGDDVLAAAAEGNPTVQPQEILRQHSRLEAQAEQLREDIDRSLQRIASAEAALAEKQYGSSGGAWFGSSKSPAGPPGTGRQISFPSFGRQVSPRARDIPPTLEDTEGEGSEDLGVRTSPRLIGRLFGTYSASASPDGAGNNTITATKSARVMSRQQRTPPKPLTSVPSEPSGNLGGDSAFPSGGSAIGRSKTNRVGNAGVAEKSISASAAVRGKKNEKESKPVDTNLDAAHMSMGLAAFLGLEKAQSDLSLPDELAASNSVGSKSQKSVSRHPPLRR